MTDSESQTALLAFWPRMQEICRKQGLAANVADDVLQETALAFWQKRSEVRDAEAWLVKTTYNRCIVYWRKLRRSRQLDMGPPDEYKTHVARVPNLARSFMRADIRTAMTRLPPIAQTVLRAYVAGETDDEVAERIGYHPTSIRKVRRRALCRLSRIMSEPPTELPLAPPTLEENPTMDRETPQTPDALRPIRTDPQARPVPSATGESPLPTDWLAQALATGPTSHSVAPSARRQDVLALPEGDLIVSWPASPLSVASARDVIAWFELIAGRAARTATPTAAPAPAPPPASALAPAPAPPSLPSPAFTPALAPEPPFSGAASDSRTKMGQTVRNSWARLTPEQRKARVAKIREGQRRRREARAAEAGEPKMPEKAEPRPQKGLAIVSSRDLR